MSARIINFPESKILRRVPEISEELKKGNKKKAVEDLVDFFNETIYNLLMSDGIQETEDFSEKDFPFLCDTIRALLYRQFELDHELHKHIDEYVKKE